MRIAKIILAFALGASGCSLVADFTGLAGNAACDGGACAADASFDASAATAASDASSASDAASDSMADATNESDATLGDGGADAAVVPITYVTSASKRIGIYQDAAVAPITSLTVTLPVAPQAGDYMLAVTYADDYTTSANNTVTPPAPFTEDATVGINPVPSSSHMSWFSARAGAGAAKSYTFMFGSSDNIGAAIIVYRNVSAASPVETSLAALCGDTTPLPAPYNYNPKPTKCTTPSITTKKGHERIVFLYGLDSSSASGQPTWTPSTDVTVREDVGNILIADIADVPAGPPSIASSTHNQTGGYTAVKMMALEPQ